MTVKDIYTLLAEKAPPEAKLEYDNVGHLVGDAGAEVSKILLALDITPWVIDEARTLGAELIVSHHPVIREGLKSVTNDKGANVMRLLQYGISAICMHTNLDAAEGGVNTELARLLGIQGAKTFEDSNIARIGDLPIALSTLDFLPLVKKILNCNGLRYYNAHRLVDHIAVCGGSGGSMLDAVIAANADTFLTSDIKYDTFLEAKRAEINLIDAGHFPTENVVIPVLRDWIAEANPTAELTISETHEQPELFFNC
ncbi:MAG: Nif3-like dinuclear metal center hexameric protein [Oscillospiraceae bacterium]|jgi:dinuclear metal center YbgI/SA1388 family protein|nr:Nif3-like dinuclear metal center hexameric protein [Oscillospiraceae bacterium]